MDRENPYQNPSGKDLPREEVWNDDDDPAATLPPSCQDHGHSAEIGGMLSRGPLGESLGADHMLSFHDPSHEETGLPILAHAPRTIF
jgi:hypothetical protein